MQFDAEVKRIFTSMGLIPRPHQLSAINLVLTEFFVNKKTSVILSADTGTGKSIIAAVVAKYFKQKFNTQNNSIILMGTNSLVKQYGDSFSQFPEEDFFQLKGASNYNCSAGTLLLKNKTTADSCIKKKLPAGSPLLSNCNSCEYKFSRRMMNETENLITNYSYYFISSLWSKTLLERTLTIFDEAHTLNDAFCEHNTIFVSEERLDGYINECEQDLSDPKESVKDAIKVLRQLRVHIIDNKINHSTYMKWLELLLKSYKEIHSEYILVAQKIKDTAQQMDLEKTGKKYFDLGCKIGDLLSYNYDHVLDAPDDKSEFSVKPLFIGNMANTILGKYNLFMSATISEEYITKTMDINKESVAYIKLDPVFDPANKPVVMYSVGKMNYQAMQDKKLLNNITKVSSDICNIHEKESGLILSPSFYLSDLIAQKIKSHKVFLHERGINLSDLIIEFKKYKKPAVLLSPSLYEGLDFPEDLSRFQIIVKAPYPSLGDKRIKQICDKHPKIYREMTLMKIVQGIGRSVRSADDYAVSYMLDDNAISLFKSKDNVWLNQFSIINK